MSQNYCFNINNSKIEVVSDTGETYAVSMDGNYIGDIYPEHIDEPPFLHWKTRDLISEELVFKIGEEIQNEDM